MTHVVVTLVPDWDSDGTGIGAELPGANLEFTIDVTEPGKVVTITITSDGIQMNSPFEPRIVPTG